LHPIRFSYKKFNEYDKLKFENDLIYIFCVKFTENLHEFKLTISLLIYIYRERESYATVNHEVQNIFVLRIISLIFKFKTPIRPLKIFSVEICLEITNSYIIPDLITLCLIINMRPILIYHEVHARDSDLNWLLKCQ
jgi:hypothetical protein